MNPQEGIKETGCCSLDSINDARKLAVDCGFPPYDFRYKRRIWRLYN